MLSQCLTKYRDAESAVLFCKIHVNASGCMSWVKYVNCLSYALCHSATFPTSVASNS
jgi:hypothetical protein